jgi:hypothetical protein
MAKNEEINILVYFMQVRDKEKNRYLGRNDIKNLFLDIEKLEYERGNDESRCKILGKHYYSLDIEKQRGKDENLRFFAGKERDANLPAKREETGKIEKIEINPTDNLVEISCGCVFFDDKILEGVILLLQKNYFGCSAGKIREYIEKIDNEKYEVVFTVLTEKSSFINLINNLKELKYVELSEVEIRPEGFGDYHAQAIDEDANRLLKIKKFRIDVRDEDKSPFDILKRIFSFFGVKELNEERLKEFISEHGLKLTAVRVPQTRQEDFDLTKDLFLFSYYTEIKKDFDKEEFYNQCEVEYKDNQNKIVELVKKVIQNL